MTTQINNEVDRIIELVYGQQHDSHQQSGVCYKVEKAGTLISGLEYTVINYANKEQGCGYGFEFNYSVSGVVYEKFLDVGFIDPPFVVDGEHHVLNIDWRKRRESVL
jgi:hypothetical protein